MIKHLLFLLSLLAVLGCGKDSENSSSDDPVRGPGNAGPIRNISDFIKKQKITCGEESCPEHITRLAVLSDKKIKFCSGVLINENSIITSAHCIPRSLRIKGLNCSENIYALFAKNNGETEVARCSKIIEVDRNVRFLEPAMWKGDYLVLSLGQAVKRKPVQLSRLGVRNNKEQTLWKLDFINSYESVIKRDTCHTLYKTYLNPFVDNKFSPMFVGVGCETTVGSQGSPMVNENGELVGLLSLEMSGTIYNFLETNDWVQGDLSRYYHMTNTGCVNFLNPSRPEETCNPQLSLNRLDTLRGNILRGEVLHQAEMADIEFELEQPERYFSWDFVFQADPAETKFELTMKKPKCVYRSKDWIYEFSRWGGRRIYTYGKIEVKFPKYQFISKLNANLRPISILTESGEQSFTVEFNPFDAHVNKNTEVTITTTLFGKEFKKTYQDVTADCSL